MKHHLVVEKKETGGICKVFNALYQIPSFMVGSVRKSNNIIRSTTDTSLYTSQSTDRIVLDL